MTLGEVLDYVDIGAPLPEKPVLITMDDGYTSNLEIAAPILEELDFGPRSSSSGSMKGGPPISTTGRS